jgi:hypothetical protein
MRISVIFMVLLSSCAAREQPPTTSDARLVVRALMSNLPLTDRGGCVRFKTAGVAFEDDRTRLAAKRPSFMERWVDPWLNRSQATGKTWSALAPGAIPLSKGDVRAIRSAEAAIVQGRAQPRLLARIDPVDIPAPFAAEASGRDCQALTSISSPAITGDLAFVEVGQTCGALCGAGFLYALRREHGRWRAMASAMTWVS